MKIVSTLIETAVTIRLCTEQIKGASASKWNQNVELLCNLTRDLIGGKLTFSREWKEKNEAL